MDFDYPKVYGDTSITDGLVSVRNEKNSGLAVWDQNVMIFHLVL